jgi:hypothetical protein
LLLESLPATFRSMQGLLGWVVRVSACGLLVSGVAQAQCTKDTECKGDRVCEAGKCTAPAATTATPSEAPAATAPAAETSASPPDGSATPAAADAERTPTSEARKLDLSAPSPSSSELPPAAITPLPHDEPATRRRSKSAMVAGVIMVSAGPIALLGALAAKNAQERCDDNLRQNYPGGVLPTSQRYRVEDCDDYSASVYVFAIGGALLTAAGIPLIIYGAKNVPNERAGQVQMLPWATRDAGGLRLRLTL